MQQESQTFPASKHEMRARYILSAIMIFFYLCTVKEFISNAIKGESVVASIVLLVPFSWFLWGYLKRTAQWRKQSFIMDQAGFKIVDDQGIVEECAWSDCQEFTYDAVQIVYMYVIRLPTKYKVNVKKSNGTTIKLQSIYNDSKILFPRLASMLSKAQIAKIQALHSQGSPANIGPFQLYADRLTYKNKTLQLSELKTVVLDKGYFYIQKQKQLLAWAKLRLKKIPNGLALFEYLDALKNTRAQA